MKKVLVIDDEQSLLKLLSLSLKKEGQTEVVCAENAQKGIESFQKDLFDCVLCDIGLPDRDGIQVLSELKSLSPKVPVVMITAHGSIQTALQAMKLGAYDYIQKPFEPEEIELVIERAMREARLEEDVQRLRKEVSAEYDFSNIIGSAPALKEVFQKIKKAADTKSTVLVTGESGTGKELLAKALHFNSSRKNAAFVVVDCGAIPANLMESELFGHLKGAFTGADRPKKGLCEEADKGTLFLDEIGELPLELQTKLLRLIQENTIRRVGDTKNIPVDVRIVAATNRNLEEESKAGRFRQDLFYRLNVVPIKAPSLRERKEDVPLLAQYFLKKYAKSYQRKINSIDPLVMNRFVSYDWPGNVRQLENLIEQMVVLAEENSLTLESLPPPLNENPLIEPPSISNRDWDLKKALSDVTSYTEKTMIAKALKHTNQNKTKAAELLGLSRRALIYKVQEYKIAELDDSEEETTPGGKFES